MHEDIITHINSIGPNHYDPKRIENLDNKPNFRFGIGRQRMCEINNNPGNNGY